MCATYDTARYGGWEDARCLVAASKAAAWLTDFPDQAEDGCALARLKRPDYKIPRRRALALVSAHPCLGAISRPRYAIKGERVDVPCNARFGQEKAQPGKATPNSWLFARASLDFCRAFPSINSRTKSNPTMGLLRYRRREV